MLLNINLNPLRSLSHIITVILWGLFGPMVVNASEVLDQFFAQTQSMQADFEQTIKENYGKVIEESKGSLIIQRPHRFVLAYHQPDSQQYVSDGKSLWIFDEELEQVTIKSFDEGLANSPALFMSSDKKIDESYRVSPAHDPERADLTIVKLTPIQEDNLFSSVYLVFKDQTLIELVMLDNFNQTTRLEFSNIKTNLDYPDKTFQFEIPPGVDVIGKAIAKKPGMDRH